MRKLFYLIICCLFCTALLSCQNKTKNYLVKKWDCVNVENLAPLDKHFITKEDSAVAIKMEAALKTLSWTFNNDNTYFCSTLGNKITVQGTYAIADDEKTLTLTSLTKNTINTYTITSISDIEMTLTSTATTVPLILHFSPN
ncbi:hypothetical protein [Ferruginibacter profundus]